MQNIYEWKHWCSGTGTVQAFLISLFTIFHSRAVILISSTWPPMNVLQPGVSGGSWHGLHGALAVLDIAETRVVWFITLPQRDGSLSLVAGCRGPATSAFLHSALMYYHGIVAVGLMEWMLLLVDLNMDEASESKETSPAGPSQKKNVPDVEQQCQTKWWSWFHSVAGTKKIWQILTYLTLLKDIKKYPSKVKTDYQIKNKFKAKVEDFI